MMTSFSKRRLSARDSLEVFYTRPAVIDQVVQHVIVPLMRQHTIRYFIDSSAGNGYLGHTIQQHLKDCIIENYDIYPSVSSPYQPITQVDFLSHERTSEQCETMVGFNPPFGLGGKMASRFVVRSMEYHQAKVLVFLLPLSSAKRQYADYSIILRYRMPPKIFIRENGKQFSHTTFLCVYLRNDAGSVVQSPPLRTAASQCGELVREMFQFHNNHNAQLDSPVVLVRRIGRRCGRQGYVWFDHKWTQYEISKELEITTESQDRLGVLTQKAFISVRLSPQPTWDAITKLILSIAAMRLLRTYKRTLSTIDISDAMSGNETDPLQIWSPDLPLDGVDLGGAANLADAPQLLHDRLAPLDGVDEVVDHLAEDLVGERHGHVQTALVGNVLGPLVHKGE